MDFQYVVSEKNGFVVVSFAGRLDEKGLPKLNDLQEHFQNKGSSTRVVLNMQDLAQLTKDVVRAFALLQKSVRSKNMDLRICSLQPTVKEALQKSGVVREWELVDDLPTALRSFGQRAA